MVWCLHWDGVQCLHIWKALGISNCGNRASFWFLTWKQNYIRSLDLRKVRNMLIVYY